jgi:hypothetical protein
MKKIICDSCGSSISPTGLRYEVTIDVRAVVENETFSLMDLVQDHRQELLQLIKRMEEQEKSPDEIEETIYKSLHLDLCPGCQQSYIRNPAATQVSSTETLNPELENFLRSLQDKDQTD